MRCGHVQWLVDTRRYGFCANSAVLGDNYCALHGGQPSSPPLVIDLTGSSNPAAGSSNPVSVIDLTEDDPVTEDDPMTDDNVCSMCSDEDDE